MAEKKNLSEKEIEKKIGELKIELLRNPTKRASIKREIARLLTMKKSLAVNHKPLGKGSGKNGTLTKLEGKK